MHQTLAAFTYLFLFWLIANNQLLASQMYNYILYKMSVIGVDYVYERYESRADDVTLFP